MCYNIILDGFLAISACIDCSKPPNYKKLYESKKIAKYLEYSPRTDSGQKVKRFFIKDFCKEFHIIGEIKPVKNGTGVGLSGSIFGEIRHLNDSTGVGLNGSGSIKICEWLTLHMTKLDRKNDSRLTKIEEVTEFCGHEVDVKVPSMQQEKLRVEPLREGILEIEATNEHRVSITLLLVKQNLIRTPPEELGNYDARIKDLQNVLAAPRRPQKLIFSQISTQVPNCEIIHMENLFGLPINLTVVFGYQAYYEPLIYQVERIDGSTYHIRSYRGSIFNITLVSNYKNEEECFSSECVDDTFICRYGAIEIITSRGSHGRYSCYSNGNYAKGLVYVDGTAALFNYSISPAKYIFE